jgi:hypothetical protein
MSFSAYFWRIQENKRGKIFLLSNVLQKTKIKKATKLNNFLHVRNIILEKLERKYLTFFSFSNISSYFYLIP